MQLHRQHKRRTDEEANWDMMEQNEITVETKGTVAVLGVGGDVTSSSEPFFNEAYHHSEVGGTSKIILRFDEEAYINSGGIAVLIQLLAEAKRNRQRVCITGLSEHFKKVFHMVGITRFADIFPSVEEALKEMG
jgi:anti-anti-sigma factor